jgi:hypothetical protein
LPSGVGLSERWLANGDRILFLANTGLQTVRSRAALDGGSLERWDTVSGRITPAKYSVAGQTLTFDVELAPAESMMLVVKDAPGQPAKPTSPDFTPVRTASWRVTADSLNVLPLDYCDLTVGAQVLRDVNTWRANWTIWQQHGFERPAWDNAVQYKTRIFDRNHFGSDSGFQAKFLFHVADAEAVKGMELALETPELYRIEFNGHAIDFQAGSVWLDPHIRSLPVGKLARVGENVLTISAQPFDVRMELENVYVRGNFRVEPSQKGFRLTAPRDRDFGPWMKQGYPFYSDSVTYESEVTLPPGTQTMRVETPEWQGSVVSVLLDGKPAGTIAWQPFRVEFPAAPGAHRVGVRVVSTPRNTLGPFHNPARPRMRAWPAAWADFPEHQPAGSRYDLLEYGLMKPPVISVSGR